MNYIYRITLIIFAIFFLTTYTPSGLNNFPKSKKTFFKIKNIEVVNNKIIHKDEILDRLKYILDKNIFFINKLELEESLKLISFIEKIEVKKKYPNEIIIKVYEAEPLAVLYKKNKKYFLDSRSNLVLYEEKMFNGYFPQIFGEEGDKNFVSFYNELLNNEFPKELIKNYYYFKIDRWDLELLNGQIIKFPQSKISNAIKQSVKLINRNDFSNYNVIDLRIDGKIIVE